MSPDLRPPIVPGDQLQRLHASRVPSDPGVVVLRNNPLAKILRVRNVNPAVERQQPIRLIPLRLVHLSPSLLLAGVSAQPLQRVPQWFLPPSMHSRMSRRMSTSCPRTSVARRAWIWNTDGSRRTTPLLSSCPRPWSARRESASGSAH